MNRAPQRGCRARDPASGRSTSDTRPPIPVAIALGSNLGDRHAHLQCAVELLRPLLSAIRVSSWHDTEPVGVGLQPVFLNGVVTGETGLSAQALLDALLGIERQRGRERPHPGAARTLDLDLILYGQNVIEQPGLRVPHPRFRERPFVLTPLAEIAPEWIDPISGLTVGELLRRHRSQNEERRTKN